MCVREINANAMFLHGRTEFAPTQKYTAQNLRFDGMESMQNNKFIYSSNNKRYHTYDYYLHEKYNQKVAKIAIDAGFSCPHIIKNGMGCIFCDSKYHNTENKIKTREEIVAQFNEKKALIAEKWRDTKYIAYFQTGTNTFASLETLKKVYESVLDTDGLVGIDIATRPDCVSEEIAEYLAQLNMKTDVTVELGLQTAHDKTAEIINRGYNLDCFERAYKILSKFKIPFTVHIINSLPGETHNMMISTVKYLASLKPMPLGIKIHMLNVIEGTELGDMYKSDSSGIKILSKDEYIDTVISMLEVLPPQVVIMRITGDPESGKLIAPEWVLKKFSVINDIDKKMRALGTYQGKYYNKNSGDKEMNESGKNKESLTNILSVAKRLLDISIKDNGVYADFTMGNGNDTLYIKKLCPSAKIYAFDIQREAIEITRKKLENENCLDNNVQLILDSHENFRNYISEHIDGAIFNLGYLPGGDKNITTKTESTLRCLEYALDCLNVRGIAVIVIYPGHQEGTNEGDEIFRLAKNLDSQIFDCLHHRLINIENAPYIIAIQKKM